MGIKWSWDPRRKRRHEVRRNQPTHTLCGRLAARVTVIRVNGPYPKDRCNCRTCMEAQYANMARSFKRIYGKMDRGELVAIPTEGEFRDSGNIHVSRKRRQAR